MATSELDRVTESIRTTRDALREAQLELIRLRAREGQLRRMLAVAERLMSGSDLDQLLDEIVRATREMIGCDIAHLNLLPGSIGANQRYRIVSGAITQQFKVIYAGASAGLTGRIVATKSAHVALNYLEDESLRHSPLSDSATSQERVVTMAGVPITWGENVVGTLMINYRTETPVDPDTLSLMASLASLTSVALDSARKFETLQNANAELVATNAELARTTQRLDAANALTGRLGALLVEEAALTDILQEISWELCADVVLLGPCGEFMGSSTDEEECRVRCRFDIDAERFQAGRLGEFVDANGRTAWFSPVYVHAELVAVLGIYRDDLSSIEHDILLRSALVIGTWVVVSRSRDAADDRTMSLTITDLMAGGHRAETAFARVKGRWLDENERTLVLVAVGAVERGITAERLSRDFAKRHGVLAKVDPPTITVVGQAEDPRALAAAFDKEVLGRLSGPVYAGFDIADPGIAGLSPSGKRARHCARSLRRIGGHKRIATLSDLGFAGVLLGNPSLAALRDYVRKNVGALIDYDRERHSELRRTVSAYFQHRGSLRDAAAALHIHPNTVHQRLQRVATLIGDNWQTPERVLEVQLSLQLEELLGESSGRPQ